MPDFSQIPWIAEHIKLYETDPEKARLWDSGPLGGPGVLPTLLLTTTGRKSGDLRSLPLIYGEVGGSGAPPGQAPGEHGAKKCLSTGVLASRCSPRGVPCPPNANTRTSQAGGCAQIP